MAKDSPKAAGPKNDRSAICFELSPTLKAKLEREAKKQERSVSYLVRTAIEKMFSEAAA